MPSTGPKPFAFVLMPFSPDFDDVYNLGIKPACADAGAHAERVDEQLFQDSILRRIYNQISKADVIVADMTGRNPNVFYETGYAHALEKPVILLTAAAEDIPFDLKHYPHIIYSGRILDLKRELEKRVRWVIENPEKDSLATASALEFFVDGISLGEEPIVDFSVYSDSIGLKIDCLNSPERMLRRAHFRLAFVTSARLEGESSFPSNVIKLPDGQLLHSPISELQLLPGEWQSVTIHFDPEGGPFGVGYERIVLRVLSDDGILEFPFTAKPAGLPANEKQGDLVAG